MRAVIVEDELLTGEHIARLLEGIGVEVIGCFTDPCEALERIRGLKPEVLFLDIEMPEMSGLSLAEQLADEVGEMEIVFVTAYTNYALDAFKVSALDYLLKPVMEEDLTRTIERVRRRFAAGNDARLSKGKERRAAVSFFGPFALRLESSTVPVRWTTAKCAEMFAYMLLQGEGKEISKWTLIDTLWKEKNVEKGDVNLRSTVSRINKTLRDNGSSMSLISVRNGYRLNCEDTELLAEAFQLERFMLQGSAISDRNAKQIENWVTGCERPFLAEFGGEWCESYRHRYQRYLLEVGLRLLKYLERSGGEPVRSLRVAEALLEHEPFSEPIRFAAFKQQERIGGRAGAIAYYQSYVNMLERELGTEPGEEFKSSYRRLLE
ncbi:response regulator [Paenibacillus sp. FSL H8-0537]|uniref:response regulator n=1 Tax=Paenibacillus sp. FSL H8-0537 TaxID=2921399 RepID=UPI0031011FCB